MLSRLLSRGIILGRTPSTSSICTVLKFGRIEVRPLSILSSRPALSGLGKSGDDVDNLRKGRRPVAALLSGRSFSVSSVRQQNLLASQSLGLIANAVMPDDDAALPRGYRAATFFGVSCMLATGLTSLLPLGLHVPLTCQPLILLPLSVTFWASLNLSSVLYRPQQYFAHFLPAGVQWWLAPVLAGIEGVSVFIRFITHSMRFVANHNAGHIMTPLLFMVPLTGLAGTSMYFTAGIPVGFVAGFYHLYETFVTCMQCYIYFLLLNMYASEHTH